MAFIDNILHGKGIKKSIQGKEYSKGKLSMKNILSERSK